VKGAPWLLPIAPIVVVFATTGVLREVNQDFVVVPQLACALALALMALIGLVRSDFAKSSPASNLIAAGLFIPLAAVGFVMEWHHHMTDCMFVTDYGVSLGPCQANRITTTTGFTLISWSLVIVTAAVAGRLIRWRAPQAWSIPAQLAVLTVLLTWLGLNLYMDISMDLIHFHFTPWLRIGAEAPDAHHARVMFDAQARVFIRHDSQQKQWYALVAGLTSFALAISIGVAATRERERPSRWLRLLESPAIVPVGIIVVAISLVLASAQWQLLEIHRGDPDDIPWFAAWASVGAVVAFASMLLRRRRREALS
jgi:hypothetical protein